MVENIVNLRRWLYVLLTVMCDMHYIFSHCIVNVLGECREYHLTSPCILIVLVLVYECIASYCTEVWEKLTRSGGPFTLMWVTEVVWNLVNSREFNVLNQVRKWNNKCFDRYQQLVEKDTKWRTMSSPIFPFEWTASPTGLCAHCSVRYKDIWEKKREKRDLLGKGVAIRRCCYDDLWSLPRNPPPQEVLLRRF